MKITEMGLSNRVVNSLHTEGIHTLDDLLSRTENRLFMIPGFGRRSLAEVKNRLAEMGYDLTPQYVEMELHIKADVMFNIHRSESAYLKYILARVANNLALPSGTNPVVTATLRRKTTEGNSNEAVGD